MEGEGEFTESAEVGESAGGAIALPEVKFGVGTNTWWAAGVEVEGGK